MKTKLFRVEFVAIMFVLIILTFILMVKPIIGVADNGDFSRIMSSTGLGYSAENGEGRFFSFINRLYSINEVSPKVQEFYISTEIILVKAAIFLNKLVTNDKTFDIRFLSLIYLTLFIFSIYIILKCSRQKPALVNWILALLIIVVFADIGYISYFNSLYGEAVSYTFLLLTVGIALYLLKQQNKSVWVLAGYFVSSFFLIGAKVQNVPLAAILILFGLRLWQLRKDMVWKSVIVMSSILLVISAAVIYQSTPERIKNCNKYQTVFYGILKDSPNPQKDLQELGLDPKFAVLAGTNFFMRNLPYDLKAPNMEKELYNKINRSKIFEFYLKHPLRYMEKLEKTANNAFMIRQDGYGNYEKSETIIPGQMSNSFSLWSSLKRWIIPNSLIFVVLFYTFFFVILIMQHMRAKEASGKIYLEIFMLIGAIGIIQFLVPVLGDGEADLSKHLFLFNVSFDMMFVISLTWLTDISLKLGRKMLETRSL
jgi:hypothetical protein